MAIRVWPLDEPSGGPTYSSRMLRQAQMAPLAFGASPSRPLGSRTGVRAFTSASTVTATSTTWTVAPHAGILDVISAAEAGPYGYAISSDESGSVTAASASNPRVDIVYVTLSDTAESTGGTTGVTVGYTAGTPAASPVAPATPARSMVLARINVPIAGGGSPTVSWAAPMLPTAILPVRTAGERGGLSLVAAATTLCPLIVWQADTQELWYHNGTRWAILAGAGRQVTGAELPPGTLTTSQTQVYGSTLTLPAGRWAVTVKGWVEWSTSAPVAFTLRLRVSEGEVDSTRVLGGTAGAAPFMLQRLVDIATGSNVDVTAQLGSATAGSAQVSGVSLMAVPA